MNVGKAIIAPFLIALGVGLMACGSDSSSSAAPTSQSTEHAAQAVPQSNAAAAKFHDDMRKLWEDHITWTRLAIISLEGGLPDANATVERLMQNQTDIGNAIKPYYGEEAGNKLTALLKDHIAIAADVIAAAKAGDNAKVEQAKTRWYGNADDIASFLASANKDWPAAEMKSMMHEHLDLTLQEAVAHLQGDYKADIAAYDKVHGQILVMADQLSSGIVKQFPQKFA